MISLLVFSALLFFGGSSWEACRRWWHIPNPPHDPGDVLGDSGLHVPCDPAPRRPCSGQWR